MGWVHPENRPWMSPKGRRIRINHHLPVLHPFFRGFFFAVSFREGSCNHVFFFVLNGLHALPPGMNVSHDPKSLGQNLCLSANLAPKKQAREEELTEIIQISKKVARVEKVEFDLTNQSYMLFLFEFCSIFFLGVWKGMFFISIFYSFTFFLVSRKDVMSNSERQPAGSVGLKLGVGPPHVLVKV